MFPKFKIGDQIVTHTDITLVGQITQGKTYTVTDCGTHWVRFTDETGMNRLRSAEKYELAVEPVKAPAKFQKGDSFRFTQRGAVGADVNVGDTGTVLSVLADFDDCNGRYRVRTGDAEYIMYGKYMEAIPAAPKFKAGDLIVTNDAKEAAEATDVTCGKVYTVTETAQDSSDVLFKDDVGWDRLRPARCYEPAKVGGPFFKGDVVQCVAPGEWFSITIGNRYTILGAYDDLATIKADDGDIWTCKGSSFVIVEKAPEDPAKAPVVLFNVGDTIKVLEDGAYDAGVSAGDIGTITALPDRDGDYTVLMANGDEWVFRPADIELVSLAVEPSGALKALEAVKAIAIELSERDETLDTGDAAVWAFCQDILREAGLSARVKVQRSVEIVPLP